MHSPAFLGILNQPMKQLRLRQLCGAFLLLALSACAPGTPTPPPPTPVPTAVPEQRLVEGATLWRYSAPTVAPAKGWQSELKFDDSAWLTGMAPIGNARPTRTFIKPDLAAQTLYLRTIFNVDDPTGWRGLRLQLDYLSGAAVYLNGVEIARANLEARAGHADLALLTRNTPAEIFDVSVALKTLRPGPNLLAVEAHRRLDGGDLLAGAQLLGIPANAPPRFAVGPLLGRLGPNTLTLQATSDVSATAILEYAPADAVTTTQLFSPTLQHVIPLTDLLPGVTYQYRLGLQTEYGTTWSAPGQWTTDGGPKETFQFAVWGSNAPRSGSSMHATFTQLIAALEARGPFAFGVTLGDSLELLPGTPDEATIRNRYLNYFTAIAPLSRQLPLYPALGNHDNPGCTACVLAFRNYYPLPEQNDQTYYSFDYGSAHLVILNTRLLGGENTAHINRSQWLWLQDDLAQTTQPIKLVFMHDDLFHTAEGGDAPRFDAQDQELFHTLFRTANVTAVFQADSHYYDYWENDGVAYIITGGATDELYAQPFNPYWEQSQGLIVRVRQTQIEIEAIMPDGLTLDRQVVSVPTK